MKKSLILPSAKLVPEELQNLGKLPAIIYPINQKLVFDYIYEQYGRECDLIKIICCEKADKVHQQLDKFVSDSLVIEDLAELDDLGHTIYFALNNVLGSVIINFSDTIVLENISAYDKNAFFYAEDYLSDTWTFFEEKNGIIESIIDKTAPDSADKKKLFVGVFQLSDAAVFRNCLEVAFKAADRIESTFFYAMRLYSKTNPFQAIKCDNWFDIGHADTYYNSKLEVKAREFNHITIDKNRSILRKYSDDREKFIGEIQWYLKLPSEIEYVRPRIFEYSTAYNTPFIAMEYYAYHTVHELFLYGDLNCHQWTDIFNRIYFVFCDLKRYTVVDDNIIRSLEDMYLAKTLQRFDRMRSDGRFSAFFSKNIVVNNVTYKSLDAMCEILKDIIPEMLYDVESFHIIHGDLCFSNIMVDGNFSFIKVIDPRGKFGTYDIYGDGRYELAKLFHSIDGKYDFIIKDLFSIDYDLKNAVINFQISDCKRDFDLCKLFMDIFEPEIGDDLKKIELIESLLFLSMIPLHGENLGHQMAMLGTGIEILSRVTDITEKQRRT